MKAPLPTVLLLSLPALVVLGLAVSCAPKLLPEELWRLYGPTEKAPTVAGQSTTPDPVAHKGVSTAVVSPTGTPTPLAGEWAENPSTEWWQWRGPERTGVSPEKGWRSDWAADPLRVSWKAAVGRGFSSVSVSHGRVYTMGGAKGTETVICLSAETGAEFWKYTYPCKWSGGPDGTLSTPAVDDGRVYTFSRTGLLLCLEAGTGHFVWELDVAKQWGLKPNGYGFACSPLVVGGLVILDVGPTVALDKTTGRVVWKAGNDTPGYSSPVIFRPGRVPMVAVYNEGGLILRDLSSGEELARARWESGYQTATPMTQGNRVLLTTTWRGCLFELGPEGLKTVWENQDIGHTPSNPVLYEGHVYDFKDVKVAGEKSGLACFDLATGKVLWVKEGLEGGALAVGDGKLVILSAKGDLVVARASAEAYEEIARAKVLDVPAKDAYPCLATPVLAGGRLYCRSHAGDLVCLDVRPK